MDGASAVIGVVSGAAGLVALTMQTMGLPDQALRHIP